MSQTWNRRNSRTWSRRKNVWQTEHVLTLNNGDEIVLVREEGRWGVNIIVTVPEPFRRVLGGAYETNYIGGTIRDAKARVEEYVEYMRSI